MLFLHIIPSQCPLTATLSGLIHTEDTSSVSTATDSSSVINVCLRTRVRPWTESVVSGLKLAVAADRDVWGGGPCSSALRLCAAVAGLRAAQVARGARQQVGVMAALLMGAVR